MSLGLRLLMTPLVAVACAVPALAQIRTVDPATGRTYELSVAASNWTGAQADASSKSFPNYDNSLVQGYLVTIGNAAENAFVQQFIGQNAANDIWIGFTNLDSNGNQLPGYQWVSGEPVTYTNWRPGEPNNSLGQEHYAQLIGLSGLWNDLPNNPTLPYVIEYPTRFRPPAVPEPGTVALATSLMTMGAVCLRRRRQK